MSTTSTRGLAYVQVIHPPTWCTTERKCLVGFLVLSLLTVLVGGIALLCCRYSKHVCPAGCQSRWDGCFTGTSATGPSEQCDDPEWESCSQHDTFVKVIIVGAFLTAAGAIGVAFAVASEWAIRRRQSDMVYPLAATPNAASLSVSVAIPARAYADASSLEHSVVSKLTSGSVV